MASSSSLSSSSSSSSSSVEQKHQVFLSFRGEDTRNNFTSHLHDALQRKAINVFIDNELRRGEEISQALLTAIQASKIYVIVLSKNYASSSWCLKELCKIVECKKTNEQKVVVPIFYHVDPSDVRNQTGKRFEEAFAKHQERFKDRSDEVERWRAALTEVGNLSGHHIIKNDRPEATHIEEIVEDILKKFVCTSSCDSKGLIGMDSRIKEIESLLCFDSPDVNVRVVGIWGMGGIGKTTIATTVYERFRARFEGCCFLANVKENYEGVRSQEYLFSKILGDRNAGTSSLRACIEDRLRHKKVLIVLDDVNDSKQLDLLPEKYCFGRGSRIIVTSRDKQVLRFVVDVTYTAKGLNDDEALQLFIFHAFKQSHPGKDFMKLSKEVVHYANGVPLALRVLGSALYGKSKSFWVDELNKLKEIPNPKLIDISRVSFYVLEDEVREIFLDIACFFKGSAIFGGMNRDYITNILDGLYVSPMSGIDILIDKFLVTTKNNMLEMHDLVQQMGRDIVCRKPPKKHGNLIELGKPIALGKRSRLWNHKDICHVLQNVMRTVSVTGMLLDMSEIEELDLRAEAFDGMESLRFLKFYYSHFIKDRNGFICEKGLNCLPETLRYLYWDGYPSKSLPSKFSPQNLVELCMPYSHVEKLWNEEPNLVKLKRLYLSRSEKLIEIPDLSKAKNLEVMSLGGCSSLVEVHSSIRYLNNLRYLFLGYSHSGLVHSNDDMIDSNGRYIPGHGSLYADLPYRTNVKKFPEIPENLEVLCLSRIAIDKVPLSIGCQSRLRDLCLCDCTRLKRLPSSICKLKSLEFLNLSGCSKLESFPEILEVMENLKYFNLNNTSIEELPSSIEHLVGLKELHLLYCENLKNLPTTIGKLHSLEELLLDYCVKLENLPTTIGNLYSLEKLSLKNCSSITKFPEIPRILKHLELSETAIKRVPSSIKWHTELSSVSLQDCEKLSGSLPRCFFKPKCRCHLIVTLSGFSKLKVLQKHLGTVQVAKIRPLDRTAQTGLMISEFRWSNVYASLILSLNDFQSLQNSIGVSELPDNLANLKYLRVLSLRFCNLSVFSSRITCISSLRELDLSGNNFETVPESVKQLLKLKKLNLSSCKRLQSLPELPQLLKLKELNLSSCKRLQSLPELPQHLRFLCADGCTSLERLSGAFHVGHYILGHTFRFTNCTNLDQKAIWAKTRRCIRQMATEDVKLYRNNNWMDPRSFHICFPGSEIPEWFDFQSPGSCVTTPLPPYLHNDHKFVGFAVCIVVAAFEDDSSGFDVDYDEDNLRGFDVECRCNVKTIGECNEFDFYWNYQPTFIDSDHVFLDYDSGFCRIFPRGESNFHLNETSFEFFFSKSGKPAGRLIKKCGVCLLYDAQEDLGVFPHRPSESESESKSESESESESDAGECNPLVTEPSSPRLMMAAATMRPRIFGISDVLRPIRSSPCDPAQLSLRCAVNNQDFVEPMVEDGTTSKRPRDDYCYDEAEPSKNFSSDEEEDPQTKRLKN